MSKVVSFFFIWTLMLTGILGSNVHATDSTQLELHHTYSEEAGDLSYYKRCNTKQDITDRFPLYGVIVAMNQTNREFDVYGLDLPPSYGNDVRYLVKMYSAGRGMYPTTKDLWEYKHIPSFK